MQYAIVELGVECDEWTTACAAESGQLEALKWLRARGIPWVKMTLKCSIVNGHDEVFRWAKAQWCPGGEKFDDDGYYDARHQDGVLLYFYTLFLFLGLVLYTLVTLLGSLPMTSRRYKPCDLVLPSTGERLFRR